MPNSLKAKLKKLLFDGKITEEEFKEFIAKLEGHDRKTKSDAVKGFIEDNTKINVMGKPFIYINEEEYQKLISQKRQQA